MNGQTGNIEYIEILKDRRNKGLLPKIADRVTPIKETVKNQKEESYETIIASIFDE